MAPDAVQVGVILAALPTAWVHREAQRPWGLGRADEWHPRLQPRRNQQQPGEQNAGQSPNGSVLAQTAKLAAVESILLANLGQWPIGLQ
mmetsp:Transcript_26858/g.77384  ORF Transcript_26858/g.77384 Transcript_26858/m.77384 type:complete len:89 (+) Transcript_26858:995-1261(+)